MEKNIISKIKQEIKEKEAYVCFLKNQRRTVRLVGERKMSSYDAAEKLRFMHLLPTYIAYYILKHHIELPRFVKSNTRMDYRGNFVEVLDNVDVFKNAIIGCCGENCKILEDKWYTTKHTFLESYAMSVNNIINEWINKYGKED